MQQKQQQNYTKKQEKKTKKLNALFVKMTNVL